MGKKVFVGMSGGVDSCAAAVILKAKGYETAGLTLSLWDEASRCCNYDDIIAAKTACVKIGMPHYVINMKEEFGRLVVGNFIKDYLGGKTPNPCVFCNERVKFAGLLKKMRENSFDFIATGHYARIEKQAGCLTLKKGVDRSKTQEYFLARLSPEILPYVLFPLGGMKKENVKKIAAKAGIKPHRGESQEACFLREKESPYDFIRRVGAAEGAGPAALFDRKGVFIRKLQYPYFRYTVGQRRGLGGGSGEPLFVSAIDAVKNRVIAGPKEEVMSKNFSASGIVLFSPEKNGSFRADVKIRYLHKQAKAAIEIDRAKARIVFDSPQFALTPGQLAVFYKGSRVIGSGYID